MVDEGPKTMGEIEKSGQEPIVIPKGISSPGLLGFWAIFLYFNLQLVVVLVSPLVLLCWKEVYPDWQNPPQEPLDQLRLQLWSQVLALPLQIGILAFFGGISLLQPGKFPQFWRFLAGFVLVSLGCHGINYCLTQLMEKGLGILPPVHPLSRLGVSAVSQWDWIALTLSACLVAPLIEEIFFRRLLPAWFSREYGPRALGLLGIGASILMSQLNKPYGQILALCAMIWAISIWLLVEWNQHWSLETRLMVSTSGLFSAIHSFAWPTPIALFFFALWQFRLARQNQGLVAVVWFHSLFNAIGVLGLLIERYLQSGTIP